MSTDYTLGQLPLGRLVVVVINAISSRVYDHEADVKESSWSLKRCS